MRLTGVIRCAYMCVLCSDSTVLKDLAMCAVSKPKKSKGKASKSTTPPPELADEATPPAPVVVEQQVPLAAKQPQQPKPAAPAAKVSHAAATFLCARMTGQANLTVLCVVMATGRDQTKARRDEQVCVVRCKGKQRPHVPNANAVSCNAEHYVANAFSCRRRPRRRQHSSSQPNPRRCVRLSVLRLENPHSQSSLTRCLI